VLRILISKRAGRGRPEETTAAPQPTTELEGSGLEGGKVVPLVSVVACKKTNSGEKKIQNQKVRGLIHPYAKDLTCLVPDEIGVKKRDGKEESHSPL